MVGAEETRGVGGAAPGAPVREAKPVCVPMSTMEEENLRERLHVAQLRQCAEIVGEEQKYSRDTFRRLFQGKVEIEHFSHSGFLKFRESVHFSVSGL